MNIDDAKLGNSQQSGNTYKWLLIVLSVNFEEALWVFAGWANLRGLRADNDMTAVATLPYTVTIAAEHDTVLDIL